MPTVCCAVGCKHITGNGVCHLKRFPNNEKRARIWAANVRGSKWHRKGWELLCDCHFESSQFEKTREDGAKKLRHNAIPTIFPTHTVPLDNSTASFIEPSTQLECQYGMYDLEPLSDAGIQKLPDTVPLLFPEQADFFDEVHFEESAYELHRADGLKKLKQNAIPTVPVSSRVNRSKRKQSVQPRIEFSFDESGDASYIAEESESQVPSEGDQFHDDIINEYSMEGVGETSTQVKGLKTLHIMEIVTRPAGEEVDVISAATNVSEEKDCGSEASESKRRKTMKVVPAIKSKQGRPLRQRGGTKVVKKEIVEVIQKNHADISGNEASTNPGSTAGAVETTPVKCFICNKVIAPGLGVHLNIPAEASRTVLHQCLEAVLSFESNVSDHEVVCGRCCSLLNYIDRTEVEMALLKGAISTSIKGRNEELENKLKLMECEQMLDRFSRGIGEKNYVMDLEELFLEKAYEEVNPGESDACQPVPEVSELSFKESSDSAGESKIITCSDRKVESVKKEDSHGQMAYQERNRKEITASQGTDQNSTESHCLDEVITDGGIRKTGSEKFGRSITCKSIADLGENQSKGGSSEEASYADEDLKNYLGGQQKTHQCQICCFKTRHESVMIWHLRVHMKTHRWCDFCSVPIAEKESVFTQLQKMKPDKLNDRKISSKPRFILPALPVESDSTVLPINLSSFNVPLNMDNISSESPVVLVDTQGLGDEFVSESVVESEENNVHLEDSLDNGVVIVSDNVFLSETSRLLQNSIPSADSASSVVVKSQPEHFCGGNSLSPARQVSEALEIICGMLRPQEVELGKDDNPDADAVLNECLTSCCGVDGNETVDGLSGAPCSIPSDECVHPTDGLEDSMETNFLDTLTSQRVAKYTEMLPEICDDTADQAAVSPVTGVPHDNIANNDVSFGTSNSIGESDLALAYESSVAALMCQSDDSDGILY